MWVALGHNKITSWMFDLLKKTEIIVIWDDIDTMKNLYKVFIVPFHSV